MCKKLTVSALTLLTLASFSQNTQGMNQQAGIPDIKLEMTIDGNKLPCFKKPENVSDKKFLLHLLEKTEFKQEIDQNSISSFVNTITALCVKNKKLLEETIIPKPPLTPPLYASRKCHPFIDALFLQFAAKTYTPRTQQERELAKERAKKITKQLVSEINNELPPLKFFTGNDQSASKTGVFKSIGIKDDVYTWKITYVKHSKQYITFEIGISKNGNSCGSISGELNKVGVEKKLKLYIASLSVPEGNRQQGFGDALLSTVIELASCFKKRTKIYLIASPKKEDMRQTLMKYYKEFGFSVHSQKPTWLKLYITENGTIIKPYEMDEYISKLRNERKLTYGMIAKKLAEEIYALKKDATKTSQYQEKKLETILESGKKITGKITLSATGSLLLLSIYIGKYGKELYFEYSAEKDTFTYLSETKNYQTYSKSGIERVINWIGTNTLVELNNLLSPGNGTVKDIPAYWMIFGENWDIK